MTHLAAAADLVFQSDIPLPGLCAASGPASYFVSLGAVDIGARPVEWIQNWALGDETPWLRCGRIDSGYVLRFTNAADVLVDVRSRRIVCEAQSNTPLETLSLVIGGQVIPRLLSLGGTPVLHASAVALDGATIVFAGQSGAGKSTLAAALCAAGGELLADDFVALQARGERFLCPPTSTSVNLANASFEALGYSTPVGSRESRVVSRPESTPAVAPPLRIIYLLEPAAGQMPAVESVGQRDAFISLFRMSYRMDPTARAAVSTEFVRLAAVAAMVPVCTLRIPRDPRQLPASVEAVLRSARTAAC